MTDSMPPIIVADGGQLTILRSLAAFCYGTWATEWHASTPEEMRLKPPDGSEFGYAARLGYDPGVMGRRFVRRDIKNIQGANMGLQVGHSETEQTLDDAAKLTQGHVFFEKDFTRENLGGLVPRVDFDVDDLVIVAMWGKALLAPVTMIEDVTEVGKVLDWNVKVGGSLIRDDRARERALLELETQIADELAKVDKVARSASNTASSAKQKADAAATEVTNKLAELKTAMATAAEGAERAKQAADRVEGLNRELAVLADEMRPEIEAIPGHLKKLANGVQVASAAVALVTSESVVARGQVAEMVRLRGELESRIEVARSSLRDAEAKRGEVAGLLVEAERARDTARAAVDAASGVLDEVDGKRLIAEQAYGEALALHQKTLQLHERAIKANSLSSAMNAQAIASLSQAQALLQAAVDANTESLANVAKWQRIQEEVNVKQGEFNAAQARLNRDLQAATASVARAQQLQGEINSKQVQVNAEVARGLEAASEAARSASEAAGSLARVTSLNGVAAQRALDAARSASEAAGSARRASEANAAAVAKLQRVNDSQDAFAGWLDATKLRMWSTGINFEGVRDPTGTLWLRWQPDRKMVMGELQGGVGFAAEAFLFIRASNGAVDMMHIVKPANVDRTPFSTVVGSSSLIYDRVMSFLQINKPVPRR